MKSAEKMLLFVVGILALVSFINHGSFHVQATPSGAGFGAGFGGGASGGGGSFVQYG
jgi:hypothetical protein